MAKIPLRAYNREIESYIEQGRTDEAIAHCRHILKFHSKHLDTYRLLGKAFLESQRYGEAADILQRVLSAVPDDFISQIGMSIIREDEGNLDAAIYHMERAHEIQPSNTAIQEEMRRLYGRRDGVEPPKVRLTRGALVRLYARGDLYPQAIAEIRAALAENPNRVDLEVILARMNYLSGQKVEAAEVCSRLVAKLPYCFEANRILAEVLPDTTRADDTRIYQQRVFSLDPYLEYITPSTPLPTDVPDHAVMVDHLEYDPNAIGLQSPEWTQSLGVEWEEAEELLPEWMTAEETTKATSEEPAEVIQESSEEPQSPESEQITAEQPIPDFMATAGWTKSDGKEPPPEEISNIDDEDADIAPAEIPDWLQSMAPEMDSESPEEDEEAARWLDNILPASETEDKPIDVSELELPEDLQAIEGFFAEDSIETEEQLEQPAEVEESPAEPGMLAELISELAVDEGKEESEEGDLPDWLTGLELEETEAETEETTPEWLASAETPDTAPTESEPDWLSSLTTDGDLSEEFKVEEVASKEDEMPEWLRTASLSSDEQTDQPGEAPTPVDASSQAVDETDEFVEVQPESIGTDGSHSIPDGETPPLADLDSTMAWLENLAAKQGADEETLTTSPDERLESPPDWIAALQEKSSEVDDSESKELDSVAAEWKPETAAEDESSIESADEREETVEDLTASDSDWLVAALAPEEGETPLIEGAGQPEPEEAEDLPDWLAEALSEESESPEAETEDAGWVPESELPTGDTVADDESIADSLQEEPSEAEVTAELGDTQAAVQKIAAKFESVQPEEAPVEVPLTEKTELPSAMSDEEIPEWLQELVDEDLTTELSEAKALDDMPDWLETIDEPKPVEEPKPEPVTTEVTQPEPETEASHAEAAPFEEPAAVEQTPSDDWAAIYAQAQGDLAKEQIDSAVEQYTLLVQSGNLLDETIQDLREALYRYPVDVSLWQILGDAYAQNNMLQDALDAYTKAEELLR